MRHVVAIDIGGTKTAGALFDEKVNIIKRLRIPTNPALGPKHLMESLFQIIEEFQTIEKIDCIAIGSAGRIDIETGRVFFASDNIPGWTGVEIKKTMEERFHIPTVVENDCKVAGLGEEFKGSAQNLHSYVCMTLGTGVGAAVKMEGKLIHGAHFSAGELGHMIIHPQGRQCNCGLKGCLEQYCSGTSLVKRYNENSEEKIHTGYDFFECVKTGDALALKLLDDFVEDLTTSILTISNMYDPEKIILGGGLIDTREYWWDSLMEGIEQSPLAELFVPVVVPASLGNDAALYGCAYLGLKQLGIVE